MVGRFLNAWQGLSCHCAPPFIYCIYLFIGSIRAKSLKKGLIGQLLCEISLFIAVSLSIRRINMAEISGGMRVSGVALLPEKSGDTFLLFLLDKASCRGYSEQPKMHTTRGWCFWEQPGSHGHYQCYG